VLVQDCRDLDDFLPSEDLARGVVRVRQQDNLRLITNLCLKCLEIEFPAAAFISVHGRCLDGATGELDAVRVLGEEGFEHQDFISFGD